MAKKIAFVFGCFCFVLQAKAQFALGKDSLFYLDKILRAEKLYDENKLDAAKSIYNEIFQLAKSSVHHKVIAYSLIKLNDIAINQEDFKSRENAVNQILEIGKLLNDKTIAGIACLQKAQFYMYTGNHIEAEKWFEEALNNLPDHHEKTALSWNDRGYNSGMMSNYEISAKYHLKALDIYEGLKNKNGIALSCSNLAVLYHDIRQDHKAIEYSKKSIEIREEQGDYKSLLNSYCNLSQIYLKVDLNEAEKYSNLCNKTAEILNTEDSKIYALKVSGLVQNYKGETREWLRTAIEILELYKQKDSLSRLTGRQYLSIAVGMSEGRLDSISCLEFFKKSLNISIINKDRETQKDVYGYINIFYRMRNDLTNAYPFLRKYHALKDSLINETTLSNIAELQTKYDFEKKDFEIKRLQTGQKIKELQINQLLTDQQIKMLEIEKQQALLNSNQLLAVQKENDIKLLTQKKELQDIELFMKNKSLQNQILLNKSQQQQLSLASKDKEINENRIAEQQRLRNILIFSVLASFAFGAILFNRYKLKKKIEEQNALLSIRDKIARDLHDDVGSTLSSIKILSEVTQKNIYKDSDKASNLLEKIVFQSEQMQQGISDIVWAVKPDNDKIENIVYKMKEYVNEVLEPKDIITRFTINKELMFENLAMEHRRDLLLIFKESVHNISKYANCTEVNISLELKNKNLTLSIRDNGTGFDTSVSQHGNGLKNMMSRSRNLNGSFTINSSEGNGTSIEISIPHNS